MSPSVETILLYTIAAGFLSIVYGYFTGKNILNANSPFPISSGHNLATTKGQFAFSKGSIPTRRNSNIGTKYDASGKATNKPAIKSGDS